MGNELTHGREKECKQVVIRLARTKGLEIPEERLEVVQRPFGGPGYTGQYSVRIPQELKPLYLPQ